MGFHHVRDAEGNLHSLDDEQYLRYLERQRNSWPNKIKRFFNKVLAVIIAIVVFIFLVGLCHDDKSEKNAPAKQTKVRTNDTKSKKKSKKEVKQFTRNEKDVVNNQEEINNTESSPTGEVEVDKGGSIEAEANSNPIEVIENTPQEPSQVESSPIEQVE